MRTAIKQIGVLTVSTISGVTGLSVAICSNILNELVSRGEVIETELEASRGGRPGRQFKFNENHTFVAGLLLKLKVELIQLM